MIFYKREAILTNEVIAEWSQEVAEEYLKQAGKRAIVETKIRLAVEELLIKFRCFYGTETPCRIVGRKRFGQLTFELRQEGPQIDPVAQPEDELQFAYDILSRLDVRPRYSYIARRHMNFVTLPAELGPVKNQMLFLMLSALVLAVVSCLALSSFAPNAAEIIYTGITLPVFNKLTAVIAALATPLVFLAVITGITGLDDAASFGRIGKRVCGAMGIAYLLAAVALALAALLSYPISSGADSSGGVLAQTVQLVLDIVPDNLLYPFTIDNDLQVIALAIFMGVVMLILGNQLRGLNAIIREASTLINRMMAVVCKLLPLVVFLGIFNLMYSSDPREFVSVGRVFILFAVCCAVLIAISVVRTRILTGIPFGLIFRKTLPTLMINLTTSSQVAALPENMHCCKDKFGIDEKLTDFALPLGVVVYMPCGAVFIGLTVLSLASVTGTVLTGSVFARVVIVSVILAIAAPPIPGSVFAVMPIMFTACGVPESVYPLAILLGTILGYLLPALNGFLLQLELLRVAIKLDQIDMDKLRAPVED